MAKRKVTEAARTRFIVLIVALVLSAPIAIWLAWPRRPRLDDPARGHMALCMSVPGQPLVILTYDSRTHVPEKGASFTDFYDRLVVYDPQDGAVLHRESLGKRRDGKFAQCLGVSGEHVWIHTEQAGYHVREVKTGAVVRSQEQLLGELAAQLSAASLDPTTGTFYVSTKDGRTHAIDKAFARTRVPSIPRILAHARSVSHVAGVATSKGVLGHDHQQRKQILLDGEPLASTDWLQPDFLVHPRSRTVEWPDPPSLIVCEPDEIGKPKQQITRLGLDGTILWTYKRPAEKNGTGCLWQVVADGSRLVMFTAPNGLVAIDPATGREAFRRAL
jgi:hypothetical protein